VKFSAIGSDPYPVKVLCRVLRVSRSGYYAWRKRRESRRPGENRRLVEAIYRIHHAVKQRYGSPRIHRELLAQGYVCGVHRVARLMRQEGLLAKRTIRFRSLTKAGTCGWAAPNVLDRHFTISKPNTVWATDISYIPTGEGHLYLAVVLDLFSRQVVPLRGMAERLGSTLVMKALQQALDRRQPEAGLLHHSDRDGLYASFAYQRLLTENGREGSMSRKGNCYDNACVESFFATLKNELVYEVRYRNRQQAQLSLFDYIEVLYNRIRRNSTLGYLSPVDFEQGTRYA
jgi:putative transposase